MNISTNGLLSLAFLVTLNTSVMAGSGRPLTPSNAKFDPDAKQVEMFDAMEEGTVEVKLVAKDSTGGNLFLSNKTEEPLTVKLPSGFAAVPVSAQFGGGMGGMGGGMGGMGGGMMGGGMGGMGGGMGGGMQSMGGGMGGMGGGMMGGMGGGMGGMGGGMGGMGGGGGFFSIPANKTLRVPYTSVCLNHGLNEPVPRAKYVVMPVEKYTNDVVLQSLIYMVGTGRLDQHSAQAATWHIANGMSWQELAAKGKNAVRVPGDNYFSLQQLRLAQKMANVAQAVAAERVEKDPSLAAPKQTMPVRKTMPVRTPFGR